MRDATRSEVLDAAWEMVRAEGLAALSFSELARRAGMRPPSLYTYFESKHAIYDAMFGAAANEFLDHAKGLDLPKPLAEAVKAGAKAFFDFCVEDPARYQLLFQRTIPGFEPSPESYAPAVEALTTVATQLAERGVDDPAHLDLLTALLTGLVSQQLSNDPGGDRWARLVDDAVDMFVKHVKHVRRSKR